MASLRRVWDHSLTGPGVRFGMTGLTVALIYLGVPFVLNGQAGVPIEVVIPIAYAMALTTHFTLQRYFVFHHVEEFALTARDQIKRYLMIAAVQYPLTAVLTAILPGVLGLSSRVTFVLLSLTMSVATFVLLRTVIFHGEHSLAEPLLPAPLIEHEVGQEDLVR